MHSRPRTMAAALLLSASLATTTVASGSAQAVTAHHRASTTAPDTARLVRAVHVTIGVSKQGVTRSRTGFRPGYTVFDIRSTGGGGTVEVMRLKHGYTLKMLRKDFGGLFNGDVEAVRRIDHKVMMYGGSQVDRHRTSSFATYLEAGRYLIANLDRGTLTWMRVAGKPQARSHPVATGQINVVDDDRFANPDRKRHTGWMRTTNRSDEPHFVDLAHVKRSTTYKQAKKYFDGGAKGQPRWALPEMGGTLVVGPGHTVWWSYDLPRGKYLEMCWWPSDEDGMPHALMGMWALTWLH